MTDPRKPLPIGINSLKTIIDHGFAYVDKTPFAYDLIDGYLGPLADGTDVYQDALYLTLSRGDMAGLVAAIKRLFAGVAWRNFTNNDLPEAEGYYASVLYAFFASLNAEIIPADISNHGQADLTVKLGGYVYVMEIKLRRGGEGAQGENEALAQVRARGYCEKYRSLPGRGVFEVGLVFGSEACNLVQADWVVVPGAEGE